MDGDGLLTLGAAFFVDKLKEQLTEEELALLKSDITTGLQPLEDQLMKQREYAESAEQIIDRQFEVIELPSLEDTKQVVRAYHTLSRYVTAHTAAHLTHLAATRNRAQRAH